MMPHLRGLFLLLLLGAGSTALALRIWDDLQRSPEMLAIVEPDAAPSDQMIEIPEMPKYDPPPIERFAATLDRPLFRPDRRPSVEVAGAVGTVEGGALSATLRGILFSNLEGVALLSPIGETTVVRVSQGEQYLGWRLLEIHSDNVVFEKDDETVTLELIYKAQPGPASLKGPPKKLRP
jgi:hypothetical protein